jgi:hypothetical protein
MFGFNWISKVSQSISDLINPTPKTLGYDPPPQVANTYLQKLPAWFVETADAMLADHQVAFGLAISNAPLLSGQVDVTGGAGGVDAFVADQWAKIWACAPKLLRAKTYGWAGFEVMYRVVNGYPEFCHVRDFGPRDAVPLLRKGQMIGVRFKRLRNVNGKETTGQVDLPPPKSLWLSYDAKYGSNFGRSHLLGAYPAWWEKVMDGGAVDLRRLRMIKDAWIGDVIQYPMGENVQLPDGTTRSWSDIMTEIIQLRASGGLMALPMLYDGNGKEMIRYSAPTPVSGATQIMDWIHDLDWDIFDGLMVPREVVEAAASGSGFSGRSIPFVTYLSIRDTEFADFVRQIDQQIIRRLVALRWGNAMANYYTIKPVPLLKTVGDLMGGMGQPNTSQVAA